MKKHLIAIDTVKNTITLDDISIKEAEKIEIKVTPFVTEVTLKISDCDVIFQSKVTQLIKDEI